MSWSCCWDSSLEDKCDKSSIDVWCFYLVVSHFFQTLSRGNELDCFAVIFFDRLCRREDGKKWGKQADERESRRWESVVVWYSSSCSTHSSHVLLRKSESWLSARFLRHKSASLERETSQKRRPKAWFFLPITRSSLRKKKRGKKESEERQDKILQRRVKKEGWGCIKRDMETCFLSSLFFTLKLRVLLLSSQLNSCCFYTTLTMFLGMQNSFFCLLHKKKRSITRSFEWSIFPMTLDSILFLFFFLLFLYSL